MDQFVLYLLNGISFGFILFLLASGLSIVLGVMGILNMAHGSLYMIGAFVGWSVTVDHHLPLWLGALAGALVAGLLGLLMERGLFRFAHQQPNRQILLSFGLVFILGNLTELIWGPLPRPSFIVPGLSRSVNLGTLQYPTSRLLIIGVGALVAAALWWFQERTRMGAIVRAAMDDKEMALAQGLNVERVMIGVFVLASAVAGFAGVVGGLVLGANSGLGIDVLLLSLIVVVVGGVGSVQGALAGAVLIGVANAFAIAFLGGLSIFTLYLVMVVVLVFRPSGIRGRAVA